MKNKLQNFTLGLLAVILLSSCFSINNFQTAKTLNKNQVELGAGLAAGSSFELDLDPEDTIGGVDDIGLPLADVVLFGRYGITDRFDVGLRFSALGDLGLDAKYMLIGDKESFFTLSPGFGLSTNSWLVGFSGIFQLEVPIHTSYQLSDNFALFITPRYVAQSATSAAFDNDSGDLLNYVGGSAGLEFGKDIKFIVGANYLKILDYPLSNFNVGAGVRYRFGGDDTDKR